MMKKILFAGALASLLVACDDSTTSPQLEPRTSDVTEISSSSETVESSSSEQGVAESSSSQEVVAVESSSSEEIPPQDTASQNIVLDSLPFDTTGIRPQLIKYTIDPDTFSNETREKAGQFLGHFITTDEIVNPYCMVMHVYENGKIVTDYMGVRDVSNCVLVVREDSLMFSNIRNCRNVPIWGSCQNAEAYSRKIKVGDDEYYFGVSEKQLQLTQLTDSTMTIWIATNPSYEPKETTPSTWKKSVFEKDTMVTSVANKVDSSYVDTISIKKYGLTITDWGSTWIFENETCTTEDFVRDAARTPEEQCKDWENYRNSFVDCTARNMKTPKDVYPRLCRPSKIDHYTVWCILDSEKPTELSED
jgi:hypothetical protein